jgi:hypothetical protein
MIPEWLAGNNKAGNHNYSKSCIIIKYAKKHSSTFSVLVGATLTAAIIQIMPIVGWMCGTARAIAKPHCRANVEQWKDESAPQTRVESAIDR